MKPREKIGVFTMDPKRCRHHTSQVIRTPAKSIDSSFWQYVTYIYMDVYTYIYI